MNVIIGRFFRFALLAFFLVMAITVFAHAEQGRVKPQKEAQPVLIEADRMESEQGKDAVLIFSGRVEARQGDLVVHSDQMRVFYAKEEEAGNDVSVKPRIEQTVVSPQKIQKFVASGNVEIVQGNWLGTSNSLEYFDDEKKVVLIGNAKVVQDNNMVEGETIVHYLEEGKSVVQRGVGVGKRVKVVLYPDAKKEDNKSAVNK